MGHILIKGFKKNIQSILGYVFFVINLKIVKNLDYKFVHAQTINTQHELMKVWTYIWKKLFKMMTKIHIIFEYCIARCHY